MLFPFKTILRVAHFKPFEMQFTEEPLISKAVRFSEDGFRSVLE